MLTIRIEIDTSLFKRAQEVFKGLSKTFKRRFKTKHHGRELWKAIREYLHELFIFCPNPREANVIMPRVFTTPRENIGIKNYRREKG